MKKETITTHRACILVSVLWLAITSSLDASQVSSSRNFTQQQLQERIRKLAQQTQTLSPHTGVSAGNNTQSTSSASSAIAPALHNPITASTPCSTDGSKILDTLYLNRKHPSNYQYQFARALYSILDEFPSELITLIMTYIKPRSIIACSQELDEHEMCVRILLPISPTKFASADQFGIIKIWELNTGTWKCITTIDTEPYNKKYTITALALLNEDWLISGAANGQIILWYLPNKSAIYTIEEDFKRINALTPLSDDSFASGATSTSSDSQQGTITLWKKTYKQNNQQTTASWGKQQTLPTENNPLFLIKLVLKKRLYIACGFANGEISLYRDDKQSWDLANNFQPHTALPLQAMTHNPANDSLICAYKTSITIFDLSLKPLRTIFPIREEKYIISTCIPWKQNQIVIGIFDNTSSQLLFFEENPQKQLTKRPAVEAYDEPISQLIAPSDQQLVSAGRTDPTIKIWEYPRLKSSALSATCVML